VNLPQAVAAIPWGHTLFDNEEARRAPSFPEFRRGRIGRGGFPMTITLEEAQAKLRELIHQLPPGEELVITENDRPVATLTTTQPEVPRERRLGTQRGSVLYMAPDFDAPLDEFKE
jgi:antitoxin (DNA-binding transcriptional repressor) of toxin-antitoxin stability system